MSNLDHLSLHEQQAIAAEEHHRQKGVVACPSYVRPKPTAAEEAQARRLNAARALPDALFDDNHEVQRLRATLRAKTALIEKRIQVRDWLAAQMARLDGAIKDAESAMQDAILEDAQTRDAGFTQTRKAVAALEFAKAVRASVDDAYTIFAFSDPSAQHALHNARDAARTALNERLFALKQAHVDAQAQAGQDPEKGGV